MISCLRIIPSILQEIDKVLVFYYNSSSSSIEGKYVSKDDDYGHIYDLNISESKSIITGLRQNSKNAGWYSQNEIEFGVIAEKGKQLLITEEDNKKILKLCFESDEDKKSDLVFVYFNSLLNILPFSNNKSLLESSDKSIIQHLLQRMIKAYLKNEKNNRHTFDSISQSAQNIIKDNENLKKKLFASNEKYGASLLNLCSMYLRKIELRENNSLRFEFDEDCIHKIKSYKGRLEDLETVINDATVYASNIYYKSVEETVIIHDAYLHFDKIPERQSEALQETGFDEQDARKFFKAISLLNRYEESAKRLIEEGRKITINSIGDYCKPVKVTGAAVSDSITKYMDDFNKLFEKYPEKWPIIKKQLKPISTKIISSKIYQSKQA